jgi:hypothetical protein
VIIMPFKLLVCGSRYWEDYDTILRYLKRLKAKYPDAVVIQGGAKGADFCAKKAAFELRMACKEYPAEWKKYGRKAGPIRNQQMLDVERPDFILAFHENINESLGTKDMIQRAQVAGVPYKIIAGRSS